MSLEELHLNSSTNPTSEQEEASKPDDLTTEFQYYGSALKQLVPTLTDTDDQKKALPWVIKFFGPEYHVELLTDKRNRFLDLGYLSSLVINIINDVLSGVFENEPPAGPTKDPKEIEVIQSSNAEWELDKTWTEYLISLKNEYKQISCNYHNSRESCKQDSLDTDIQYDIEFRFLLYQIRPYVAMLPKPESRTKLATWMQTLCRISKDHCSRMKMLRNEYAYALYSYVQDLRVAGPFVDYPPFHKLKPLKEASDEAAKYHPLTSPFCEDAESFMCDQPTPEEGAFCYIAVTGDFDDSDTFSQYSTVFPDDAE